MGNMLHEVTFYMQCILLLQGCK